MVAIGASVVLHPIRENSLGRVTKGVGDTGRRGAHWVPDTAHHAAMAGDLTAQIDDWSSDPHQQGGRLHMLASAAASIGFGPPALHPEGTIALQTTIGQQLGGTASHRRR